MKVIVFGAGAYGRQYIENCPRDEEIVAVCDNNWNDLETKKNNGLFGHRIVSPDEIPKMDFDRVVIALNEHAKNGPQSIAAIRDQLAGYGVPINNILLMSKDIGNDSKVEYPRIEFLRELSNDFYEFGIEGAVAECGVCWGDFAVKINEFFPDRTLYLFDTFASFDERDFGQEIGDYSIAIDARELHATANQDFVYLKMPCKDNVVIRQGYIPETLVGIDHERFCFVNVDVDLYAPTIASLRFFADKMVRGGIILVHDYYVKRLDGVKRAVLEFADERDITKIPIGDDRSVAIMMAGEKHRCV
jgi:hypothetical protein